MSAPRYFTHLRRHVPGKDILIGVREELPPQGAMAMRKIHSHKVNPANDVIEITVVDEPGSGGACHRYDVTGFDTETNPSRHDPEGYAASFSRLPIIFQNGPIAEAGVNGVTHEVLLAILIDRLEGFQAGQYACRENALALTKLQEAQQWLQSRTRARMARGVEGTHAA